MRISFGHKSPQILMNCTAATASERARSLVRSGQAPYRRQVARFAINLLPDLCPRSTLASKFIAAAARLSMKALHPTRTTDPTDSHGPLRSLVLGPFSSEGGGGKLGRWLTSFFNVSAVFKANRASTDGRMCARVRVCVCASVSPAQCRTV